MSQTDDQTGESAQTGVIDVAGRAFAGPDADDAVDDDLIAAAGDTCGIDRSGGIDRNSDDTWSTLRRWLGDAIGGLGDAVVFGGRDEAFERSLIAIRTATRYRCLVDIAGHYGDGIAGLSASGLIDAGGPIDLGGPTDGSPEQADGVDARERFGPRLPGFTHADLDDTESLGPMVDSSTAAIILPPLDHAGNVRDPQRLRSLRSLADQHDLLIVLDHRWDVPPIGPSALLVDDEVLLDLKPDAILLSDGLFGHLGGSVALIGETIAAGFSNTEMFGGSVHRRVLRGSVDRWADRGRHPANSDGENISDGENVSDGKQDSDAIVDQAEAIRTLASMVADSASLGHTVLDMAAAGGNVTFELSIDAGAVVRAASRERLWLRFRSPSQIRLVIPRKMRASTLDGVCRRLTASLIAAAAPASPGEPSVADPVST